MEMVLREGGIRDDGLNVDPVSGNEIPSGSLAEEVRDDIPAQLSGGEYVVPADVVRFFGVKYFEDLRMEAKSGLQDMERNGRIGGEPMMAASAPTGQGITEADLQALEAMMTTGVYSGGLMDKIAYTIENDPLVNERVNKKGTPVKFAQGGQVSSAFSDTNEIDKIIDQVSVMAQQNPSVMQELQQRGISVNQPIKKMAPGGYVGTNSIYQNYQTPGYSTVIGGGRPQVPQAVTEDVTAEPVTPTTPVGPQPTPDVGQCGANGRWDGFGCIYGDSDGGEGGGDSGGGGTASSGKSWYEEGDITDIDNYVDNQLKDVISGGAFGSSDASKGVVENFLTGALSNLPMVKTIQGFGKLDKIARARAAVEVNQRAGLISDKKAAALDAQITDAARDAGILGLANTVATGSGNAGGAFKASDKFGNNNGEIEPIEIIEWLGTLDIKGKPVVVPEGSSGTGPAPTNGGAAKPTTTTTVTNNNGDNGGGDNGSGGGGSYGDTVTGSGKTQSEIDAGAGGGGYNSSPTGETSTSKPSSSSTATETSDDYATGDPGMQAGYRQGGLMKKRKKKQINNNLPTITIRLPSYGWPQYKGNNMPELQTMESPKNAGFINPNHNNRNRKRIEEDEKELEELQGSKEEVTEEETSDTEDKEKTLSREEKSFKKRYGDLRRHMSEKETEWKEKFETLEGRMNDSSIRPPKSEEDVQAWIAKYPDVASIVETIASKKAESMFSKAEKRLQEIDDANYESTRLSYESKIRKTHEDFDDLKSSDEFHDWADEQPKWVQDALYENPDDPASVIRVIDLYKSDKGLTKVAKKAKTKEAASVVSKRSKTSVDASEGESMIKESDIAKMSDKDFEKNQEEITKAMRTGKFIYDISGNAR